MSTPFKYKRGRTEIESDSDNKEAVRLAKRDTMMFWLWRYLIVGAIVYRMVTSNSLPSFFKEIAQAFR